MRTIHLLWATVRCEMFKETVEDWLCKSLYRERIKVKVAVDTEEQKAQLEGFDVQVTNPPRKGVAYPAHLLTTSYDQTKPGDIIIFSSDDFYPPWLWDDYIESKIEDNCCLLVNDGITGVESDAVTLPILDHFAFIKLNRIIYNRAYRHMFSDSELYYNCAELGLLKNLRATSPVFEHKHYANGKRAKDELDDCNQSYFYDDRVMFRVRKQFPIERKLI